MPEQPTILVTAATGKIGRLIVKRFSRRGLTARALVRDAGHQRNLPGVVWAVGDFSDARSMDAALAGVEVMYLACGESSRKFALESAAIDAVKRKGVKRVVKVSAYDSHDDNASDFRRTNGMIERYLRNSGLDWTVLRPTIFNQALDPLGTVAKGVLLSSQGVATIPFIDTRDIADVAVTVLTGQGHEDRIHDLTGPEAFTQDGYAALLSEVFRKSVVCRHVSDLEAYRDLLAGGMDEGMARSMIAHWQSYRARPATLISGWTEILTGHASRTLRAYLEECANAAKIG